MYRGKVTALILLISQLLLSVGDRSTTLKWDPTLYCVSLCLCMPSSLTQQTLVTVCQQSSVLDSLFFTLYTVVPLGSLLACPTQYCKGTQAAARSPQSGPQEWFLWPAEALLMYLKLFEPEFQ